MPLYGLSFEALPIGRMNPCPDFVTSLIPSFLNNSSVTGFRVVALASV